MQVKTPAARPKSTPLRRWPAPRGKPVSSIISTMPQVQARSRGAIWMVMGSWLQFRKRRISAAPVKSAGISRSQNSVLPRSRLNAVHSIARAAAKPLTAAIRPIRSISAPPSRRAVREPKKTSTAAQSLQARKTGSRAKQASVPGRRLSRVDRAQSPAKTQAHAATVKGRAALPTGSRPFSSKAVFKITARSAARNSAQQTAAQRSSPAALEAFISVSSSVCFFVL